jgi:hypothetical protein
MDVEEAYRYLGTGLGSRAHKTSVLATLDEGLGNITRAPLKPQQRLRILTDHLLPKLTHRLSLEENIPGHLLRDADRKMRRAVRSWLHLPSDVTNDFLHTKVKSGGLGVYQHTVQGRLVRRARIDSVITRGALGTDLALTWLAENCEHLQKERLALTTIVSAAGIPVNSTQDHATVIQESLYTKVDGYGLRSHSISPNLNGWV